MNSIRSSAEKTGPSIYIYAFLINDILLYTGISTHFVQIITFVIISVQTPFFLILKNQAISLK